MKKTALYIRVSTDAQYEEGYSVEAQKQKLRQYCKLKDITDYEYYIDGGWSGSNIDRPEMRRLIEDISENKIAAVIVYKLDRLSRSQKDTVFLLEDVFIPHNCDFVSLNENFDTTTPYGKAMIGILSVFAQLERENIRERTRMGMYERVKEGLWPGGGKLPFGYDYDAGRDILVPNEHAEDVKQIYELYLRGYSTTQLAKMFDVSGDKQITDILSRITYLGKIKFRGSIIDAQHKPLIDQKTWEKAQEERKKRARRKTVSPRYLLTGLLYCGKCGAKMRYQKWGRTDVKIYCYSQQTSKKYLVRDENCDNLRADADDVESAVLSDLFRRCEDITASAEGGSDTDALKILRQRYTALTAKIKRLYNLYAESGDELLLETINENKDELLLIAEKTEDEKSRRELRESLGETRDMMKNLGNSWEYMSQADRQRAVRLCIDRIVLTDGKADIYYNF